MDGPPSTSATGWAAMCLPIRMLQGSEKHHGAGPHPNPRSTCTAPSNSRPGAAFRYGGIKPAEHPERLPSAGASRQAMSAALGGGGSLKTTGEVDRLLQQFGAKLRIEASGSLLDLGPGGARTYTRTDALDASLAKQVSRLLGPPFSGSFHLAGQLDRRHCSSGYEILLLLHTRKITSWANRRACHGGTAPQGNAQRRASKAPRANAEAGPLPQPSRSADPRHLRGHDPSRGPSRDTYPRVRGRVGTRGSRRRGAPRSGEQSAFPLPSKGEPGGSRPLAGLQSLALAPDRRGARGDRPAPVRGPASRIPLRLSTPSLVVDLPLSWVVRICLVSPCSPPVLLLPA
jgi:hypothetical protein